MAIASKWLGANYNRPGFDIFNFNVYAMCGDGDMMEGVACEAASLAGTLGFQIFAGFTTTPRDAGRTGGLVVQRRCDDAIRGLDGTSAGCRCE